MEQTERRYSVRIDGWPSAAIDQAPADIELVTKPENEDRLSFLSRPGLICQSSGLSDSSGATLMHVIWKDPDNPGRTVSNSWIIKEVDGNYTCDWERFRDAIDSIENLPPLKG